MTRNHSVLDVAALCLVGLAGIVTLMIAVTTWNAMTLGFSLALLALTALIWSGGRRGSLATVVGLLAVAIAAQGIVGFLTLVVLFTWAGERATRVVRARESADDPA